MLLLSYSIESIYIFFMNFSSVEANLHHLMSLCAVYFPKSAPQEILDEFMPQLMPLDTGKHCGVFEMLSILGTVPHGHELWLYDFMNLWNTYQNPPWAAVSIRFSWSVYPTKKNYSNCLAGYDELNQFRSYTNNWKS